MQQNHNDFNIKIALVKELQDLVNKRIKMDNAKNEKKSFEIKEYLTRPKGFCKVLKNLLKVMQIITLSSTFHC